MPYSTLADIQKKISNAELIQLTDDVQAGSIDQDVVDAAIAEADDLIDSYAGKVKKVPMSPVPGIVAALSATIAVYKLYARRAVVDEFRESEFTSAVKLLQDIGAGRATLGEEDADVAGDTARDVPQSSTGGTDPNFNDNKLGRF